MSKDRPSRFEINNSTSQGEGNGEEEAECVVAAEVHSAGVQCVGGVLSNE